MSHLSGGVELGDGGGICVVHAHVHCECGCMGVRRLQSLVEK